ncbi:unnamed protein product, partial [Anisakis simplex]|uniref:BTB domain-containing protein n=1 Tax=Anisakis simplex TaxID=6269 RepID=A0A0M3JE61_ANISI
HGGVNNIPTIDSTKNGTAAIGEVPPEEPAHHMEVEEEKEPKEPTLAERVSTLRENSIGFDVIFHVGPSNNPKIVQAHRAILAAGSKVLSNTFFNSDVSTPPSKKPKPGSANNSGKLVLEYPDVNPVAFDTVIDYLYSDFEPKAININESAVLDTLYAG